MPLAGALYLFSLQDQGYLIVVYVKPSPVRGKEAITHKKERKKERKIYERLLRPILAHETNGLQMGYLPMHRK